MQVRFCATGQQTFSEKIHANIADRNPTASPDGIPFALTGESCVPGIDCDNVRGIFEEHTVRQQLDPLLSIHNEYGIQDKVSNA
jgi:hydrocephalus-inducing protein